MKIHWLRRNIGIWPCVLAFPFMLAVAACDQNDGAVEEAGEKVDEAIKDTTRSVEDAAD